LATVSFDGVGKVYGDGTRAVRDFDLAVADGEFVVLVGPSGCGKTTVLRMLAGLEEISEGEIRIDGKVVNDLEARDRDVAMVFQNYALYPHYDVHENIAFGLKVRKVPRKEIRRRVEAIARVLGLYDLLKRRPRQLSGGQRQRVAMGRAIVREPLAFLMDEPLSNLDAKLRVQMRAEISRIQRELNATTIYVTHDQVEAMTMADRVAVLHRGELQQTDVPQKVYDEPANLFVASFIGSPAMNLLEGEIVERDGVLACVIGDQELRLDEEVEAGRPALRGYAGRRVAVGIRPEDLGEAAARNGSPLQRLRGTVLLTEALGPEVLAHVEVAARPVLREEVLEAAVALDAAAVAGLESEARQRRTTIVGRFDSRTRVARDDEIELGVDPSSIHFFNLETGEAVTTMGDRLAVTVS
jgi:multiple sugar transport system ATP-binding protein